MIKVVGLGPGGLDRLPGLVRDLLLDPTFRVILRTSEHPAAAELAALRTVETCDDLYQVGATFDDVYRAIADRVASAAASGPVIYAVPGSPLIGELAVRRLVATISDLEMVPAQSFLDAVLLEVGYDPLERGLQVLNGHDLPVPLALDKPTVISQLDHPVVLAEVAARIDGVVDDDAEVVLLSGLGAPDAKVFRGPPSAIDPALAGLRTSIFVDVSPGGLAGVVQTMRRLRAECPWDREQSHASLVKNLVEETYELIEAISSLGDGSDAVADARVADELGDVLLQVLFHAAIAEESGRFDIDTIGESLRRKLVRRHPHVFSEVVAETAKEVKANWDEIKREERGEEETSAMDWVPEGLPALQRAAKLQNRAAKAGYDQARPGEVVDRIREDVEAVAKGLDYRDHFAHDLGDLLFDVVNLARHLETDPETALRRAVSRFEERFRSMESDEPVVGIDAEDVADGSAAKPQP